MGQHCFDLVIVTTLTTGPYREFISAVKSQLAVEDEAEAERNRAAKEAVRLCRLNERSRAMSRLTSSGIAPPSRHVAELLRQDITGGELPSGEPRGICLNWRGLDLPRRDINHGALRKRLREAPRVSLASAAGSSGSGLVESRASVHREIWLEESLLLLDHRLY